MTNTITTYELALRDVNTGSYPVRENGVMILTNGQKDKLSDVSNNSLRELYSKLESLKIKKEELINQMLSKQSLFDSEQIEVENSGKKLEKDIDELSTEIEVLKTDIEDEEQRLEARSIPLPVKPIFIKDNEGNIENHRVNIFQNLKKHWQPLKKWLGVFAVIVVLEAFFGLALWDSLRDQKSMVQVILRIAASGALVISLHLAEIKYKKKRVLVFGAYIIYGIISLVVLLVGSLVLGYFFPEYLDGGVSTNVFDLNNNGVVGTDNLKKDWVGFFLRYDFLIGVFGVIVYMLLSFLDRKKVPAKNDDTNIVDSNLTTNSSVTAHLTRMYSNLFNKEQNLEALITRQSDIKNKPSGLLKEIRLFLSTTRESIEKIDHQITETENAINRLFREIESVLDKYKTDFLDIFKNKPASQFVQLDWPTREDIKKYYNIV